MAATTSSSSVSNEVSIAIYSVMNGTYVVKNVLGEGSYGKVVRCTKMLTRENVAVKAARKTQTWAAKKELAILQELSVLDPDKCNLVKFYESFMHDGYICLVMELLDKSLHQFMGQRHCTPMSLSVIRVIAQQILVALNALKSIGLVHADIKPDNVMLVDQCRQPFRIKLIDFGLAKQVSKITPGTLIQALGYRAPEVLLGLPVNEAADMWSLGCLLAFLYLGQHLYPLKCEYEVIRILIQMHGGIDDHLLDAGMHTKKYFYRDTDSENQTWKLKTSTQYRIVTDKESKASTKLSSEYTCLEDITKDHPRPWIDSEKEDTLRFLSLLKRMLHVDPATRITTGEGLQHEFITMRHFPDTAVPDPYVKLSREIMTVCPPLESEAEKNNFDDGAHGASLEPGPSTADVLDVQNNTDCASDNSQPQQKQKPRRKESK